MPVIHETGLITAPVAVYFETFAPAAATDRATVVMVHGGAHSGACYQRTADGRRGWAYLFAERGYRSVVPDWPGTGRSGYIPLDRLNGATVMEGLGALIRSLGAPVILMTHSMSGCYGWRLLELHGDIIERLVGVAPGPPGNIQKAAPVYAETNERSRPKHPVSACASTRVRRWFPLAISQSASSSVRADISRASGSPAMPRACTRSRPILCLSGRTCTAVRCA